jgi:hypothetical protein
MRTATLMLSIVAHVIAACALIIAPLYATDTLPEPRSATEFIRVVPLATPTPPPVRLDRTRRVAANRDAAPIEVPDGIPAEEPFEPVNDAIEIDRNAIVFGSSDVPIADLVPPPPTPPPPVRVGGEIRPPQRVTDVAPVYPAIAQSRGRRTSRGSSFSRRSSARTEPFATCACCGRFHCSTTPRSTR